MAQPIDFNKSEQYILSIRLSTDGFSFSIYHPQQSEEYISVPRQSIRSAQWLPM